MGKAGALGRLAAVRTGAATVHTFHGHHLTARGLTGVVARRAEGALARATTAAVCLSETQRRDVSGVFGRDDARLAVVGPGLDVEALRASAATAERARLRASWGSTCTFVWPGRFVTVKDPHLWVEAAARARVPWRAVLVGRGPLAPAVRAAARRHDVAERVVLVGAVREIAPWIAAADAVALCSRSEGTPLAIVEARVLGRPVVATNVGGVSDLVEDGVHGLLVPPHDPDAFAAALDRLAGDAALRERLAARSAEGAAERFDGERMARETAALYERVGRRATRAVPSPP
jgi:glycosyltransferase involved in cell wall biosynthesis